MRLSAILNVNNRKSTINPLSNARSSSKLKMNPTRRIQRACSIATEVIQKIHGRIMETGTADVVPPDVVVKARL